MERWTNEDGVQGLFEVFTVSQHLILNAMDYHQLHVTKYQFYLMMTLARKESLTMSQAAACIGCSKEQATRLVAALVEEEYVERIHSKENRKLVIIRLTQKGAELMCCKKDEVREKLRKNLDSLSDGERELFFQSMGTFTSILKKLETYQEKGRRVGR